MAMHRARLAVDVDTILKLATKERADKMREAGKDPEFP
jgi:hypothetical protein